MASWRSKRELAPAPPTTDGPSSRGLPLAGASIYSKFRSTPCGSGAVRRVEVSCETPRPTHRPAMGRSADSPRQLGIALGAIGASDQFHILMGGHPTVFVKNQEGGPCDHLTLS